MLYDPKWGQSPKVDALSLPALIAWLEKQPAEQEYCYLNTGHCLAAQYNESIGRKYSTHSLFTGDAFAFDYQLEEISVHRPHTFGDALDRARGLLNGQW